MMDDRRFDIVLFGATGFTGGLTAEYLARKQATEPFTWALAGRNRPKLEAVRERLAAIDPALAEMELISADTDYYDSLLSMAQQTRIVLTTVGPFNRYGEPLVKACVAAGTDYVDSTGEPNFVNKMVNQYDEAARQKNVRIVNCCGFDSIPHDYGAWLAARALPDDEPIVVEGFLSGSGTFSGGTFQTAVEAMAFNAARIKLKRQNKPVDPGRKVRSVKARLHRSKRINGWAVPLPTIDPHIVKRTARILPEYGPNFKYGHYLRVKRLPTLVAGGVGIGAAVLMAQTKPTRNLLLKIRPTGEGPDEAKRAKSRFKVTFFGRSRSATSKIVISGGDPGYDETAKMLSEAALCLIHDRDQLPDQVGVLTPVLAFREPLLHRLMNTGIQVENLSQQQ
ncbi:MAG: saccharopine dehydrogenase NADP-binding domain-containing protein [Anaerolineae bacterium]|nr:saccharopine dehydrogenase NADP-binding domain-containing protein [Anaerolineae bacterium]